MMKLEINTLSELTKNKNNKVTSSDSYVGASFYF